MLLINHILLNDFHLHELPLSTINEPIKRRKKWVYLFWVHDPQNLVSIITRIQVLGSGFRLGKNTVIKTVMICRILCTENMHRKKYKVSIVSRRLVGTIVNYIIQ